MINDEFRFEIQPNLILYNQIFELPIVDRWMLQNFSMFRNSSNTLTVFEDGKHPVCISFMTTAILAIPNRDEFVRDLMS